jgi:hypothetical protein
VLIRSDAPGAGSHATLSSSGSSVLVEREILGVCEGGGVMIMRLSHGAAGGFQGTLLIAFLFGGAALFAARLHPEPTVQQRVPTELTITSPAESTDEVATVPGEGELSGAPSGVAADGRACYVLRTAPASENVDGGGAAQVRPAASLPSPGHSPSPSIENCQLALSAASPTVLSLNIELVESMPLPQRRITLEARDYLNRGLVRDAVDKGKSELQRRAGSDRQLIESSVTVKVNAIHFDRQVGDVADQLTGELFAVVSATTAQPLK